MRNVSDKSCRENQNTLFVFSTLKKNRAINEKTWKNIVDGCWPQMAIWRMRIACWIP